MKHKQITNNPEQPTIVFIYNANTGLFNALADSAHKIFSPKTYSCQLCKLTHGLTRERSAWRDYLSTLNANVVFLHRDEADTSLEDIALPAILMQRPNNDTDHKNQPQLVADGNKIRQCKTLDDLIKLIDGVFNM